MAISIAALLVANPAARRLAKNHFDPLGKPPSSACPVFGGGLRAALPQGCPGTLVLGGGGDVRRRWRGSAVSQGTRMVLPDERTARVEQGDLTNSPPRNLWGACLAINPKKICQKQPALGLLAASAPERLAWVPGHFGLFGCDYLPTFYVPTPALGVEFTTYWSLGWCKTWHTKKAFPSQEKRSIPIPFRLCIEVLNVSPFLFNAKKMFSHPKIFQMTIWSCPFPPARKSEYSYTGQQKLAFLASEKSPKHKHDFFPFQKKMGGASRNSLQKNLFRKWSSSAKIRWSKWIFYGGKKAFFVLRKKGKIILLQCDANACHFK